MLGQRRRRVADVVQLLYKCFVFNGWFVPSSDIQTSKKLAGPDGSFGPVVGRNSKVLGSNPVSVAFCTLYGLITTEKTPEIWSMPCAFSKTKKPSAHCRLIAGPTGQK